MNLQNQVSYLPTMLDGVTLPTNDLDVELLKSVIMERCGLLEPLYSEPETMKQVISIWFRAHQWNIAHVIDLVKTSYKPLENYDRHEDLARDKNDTRNRTENRTENITENRTENRTQNYSENGEVTTNEETERTVAAFNTSAYSPADKTLHDASTTTETSGTTAGNTAGQTAGTTAGQTAGTEAGAEAEHAVNYIHGNVGVTTTQAMFMEELNLLGGFNAYQFIAEMFSKDLMLSIW